MPSYLQQICHALGLLDGSVENIERLQRAARWALADEQFTFQTYEPTALKPVLGTLKARETDAYIPAIPLTLEEGKLMPKPSTPTKAELEEQLDHLKRSLKNVNSETQFLTALEVHASTLAVSNKYHDLSLFDFCKITAGIVNCLERSNQLRLVGGSISGIQSYLYEIVSKNAAKLLKGRSFYLQLLTDSLLEELLAEFDLSVCNVIYASGGGFFVLIPDVEGIESKFEAFTIRIAAAIYARHKTALFAELAITPAFDATAKVNIIWKELYDKLELLKCQKLHNNDSLLNDFFNDALEVGGIQARDPITNDEISDTDETEKLLDDTVVLKYTKQQIDLGRKLAKADYWFTSDKSLKRKETIEDPFENSHGLAKDFPREKLSENYRVRAINRIDTKQPFTFYGGNQFPIFSAEEITKIREKDSETPHHKGDVKTFEYLVESDGLKRLAILRMDVDGLGAIFSHEIAKIHKERYKISFTRYATASRSLDYFFKGYLNTLQKPYQDSSIIIYSGGDDLFLVGRWNDVLQLAQRIQSEFAEWSCRNLTLSGGIVLLPSKFPVMQGARLAAYAEKKAKKHSFNSSQSDGFEKNSICLFDVPLNWNSEFAIVRELYQEILQLLTIPEKRKALNKSFLDKISSHASAEQLYEKLKKNGKPAAPKWRWVMAYDMTRYRDALDKEATGARSFIDRISKDTFMNMYKGQKLESNYSFLMLLQIAVRWVELQYRTEKSEEFLD